MCVLMHYSIDADYKAGFGGEFGVQSDRVDKSALGWEHKDELNKHESQKDYAKVIKRDVILIVE